MNHKYHYTDHILELISKANLYYFAAMIALTILAFVPIYKKLKLIFQNRLSLFLVAISIIGTLPLFAIAVDWGRFIYIHATSIFLITLIPVSNTETTKGHVHKQSINVFTIIFFLMYVSSWKIPHCCGPSYLFATNYKQVNIVNFATPYEKIAQRYFPALKRILKNGNSTL